VIKSRNADVKAVAVSGVEGKPIYGGDMLVKPLIKGDEMTFLEIHYAAGVGAPLSLTAAPRLAGCSNASHQLSSRRSRGRSLVDLDCAGLDTRDQLATEFGRIGHRIEAADQER
jgi:hypothetical protein